MDREKVETGFELCANGEPCIGEKFMRCPFSPRNNAEQNCGVTMARNALALLKEREAVEPTWQQGKAYCGSCGKRIPLKIGARFCHNCGQAVKWE